MSRATELAERLEVFAALDGGDIAHVEQAAAELRRLYRVEQRYQWLRERLLGADFSWGDPATCVWVFETDAPISADLDASIDAAIAAKD
jgi:hypothetical protein